MIASWRNRIMWGARVIAALATGTIPDAASSQLVLSEVIVDLAPTKPPREDIEAWNSGSERLYVVAEPAEIVGAGTAGEHRVEAADPSTGGLLVTPQRMVLEPGERRLVRIAALAARPDHDRIYRVTIKPVVGDVDAAATAIKVLVGYDVLVIWRPSAPQAAVVAERASGELTLLNTGNTSAEIYGGRQCDAPGEHCTDLPSTRLYAGARWNQKLPGAGIVSYRVKVGDRETVQRFAP